MYYLVKYNDNWADEMDINGFALFTEEEHDEFISMVNKICDLLRAGETFEYYIGTNEFIIHDYEPYFADSFKIHSISPLAYEFIRDNMCDGGSIYGFFPMDAMWDFLERYEHECEEEEE